MILNYKAIQVYFEDEGEGEVVLLLHGFLENSNMWESLKPELLKSHRVISVDLLGHGQTGCLGYVHPMPLMAEAVQAVLSELKVEHYAVIGHSMGGYVALALAEAHPKAIKGLCLLNSTFEADDEARIQIRKRANAMAQRNYEALVRMSFINLFSAESIKTYEAEIGAGLTEALKTPIQGYMAAQLGMAQREDKFEFFKGLEAKKLIVTGSKDPVVNAKLLAEKIEDTPIILKQLNCGHMSYIEKSSDLTYIINRFNE